MYQGFFGLAAAPFELNHNPAFVFATPRQTAALRLLADGLSTARPLTVLVGHPGVGKTTILRLALASDACRAIHCVHLSNPTLADGSLVDVLLAALQAETGTPAAIAEPGLPALHALLAGRHSRGVRTALMIDESENLGAGAVEELSALIAMRSDGTHLLPVVLAGLPALKAMLDRSALRTWMAASPPFDLARMDLAQTASYILSRVGAAGADGGSLFTREAVALIHERARGVPRTISVICDNALLASSSLNQRPVRRDIVAQVCRELDLDQAPPSTAEPKPHELARHPAAI